MHLYYQDDIQKTPKDMLRSEISEGCFLKDQFHPVQNLGTKKNKDKKDPFMLKRLVTKSKAKILAKSFIMKSNRNNPYRKPPDQFLQQEVQQISFLKLFAKYLQENQGIFFNNFILSIWCVINIFQITCMVFIFSIMIPFNETQQSSLFFAFRVSSVFLYLIDMILNFITQKFENGKKLVNMKQISQYYLKNGFFVDFVSIFMFPVDILSNLNVTPLLLLVAFIKLLNNIRRFQKFQYLYVKTNQREQYFGLIKVFMTNFAIGHILSILLNLMSQLGPEHNWYNKISIQNQTWLIKYIWGYYWGTNIMLTVGFGDISATNYSQAICLIFIETFSCIVLAFNISNVGALISQIRASKQKKQKQLKVFHRMSQQNQISIQLNSKVINFIEESFQIKDFFQFDQEDNVIASLPKTYQSQYRAESNRILFDNIGFFKNLSSKTLILLAEKVQRKISHPQEIYKKKGSLSNFSVILKGSVGLTYKKSNSKKNGQIIQTIEVHKNDKPKAISLDFIKKKIYEYDIKSLGYSIIYFLEEKDFANSLRQVPMDFQLFCIIRDKDDNLINQYQIYHCSICQNQYHNKFNCSRLHFIPIKQHVINIYNGKKQKCNRIFAMRSKNIKSKKKQKQNTSNQYQVKNVLQQKGSIQYQAKKFMVQKFSPSYLQKIQGMWKYVQKVNRIKKVQVQRQKRMKVNITSTNRISQKQLNSRKTNIIVDQSQIKGFQNLQKLLLRQKQKYNEFWSLQSDTAHNFKYYFIQQNPDNLSGPTPQSLRNKHIS